MSTYFEDKDRNVIPRWRDFLTTLVLGELLPSRYSPRVADEPATALVDQLSAWQEHGSTSFAADLVGSALVLNISNSEIRRAAKHLLSPTANAPHLAKDLANQLLSPEREPQFLPPEELSSSTFDDLQVQSRHQIRTLRRRLLEEPRNSILLTDLSRQYTISGLREKAKKAMIRAVEFGSENRFVLRSAARLYIHLEEPDRAHFILRRAQATREDPWLMAAEIAVAAAASKNSTNVKSALRVLEGGRYAPFEISELASAVATVEMANANNKAARKLFRRALESPTENTVAQVEWASRRALPNFEVKLKNAPPRLYEAKAWDLFNKGDWGNSFDQSMKWLHDQSFSVHPVLLSGYLASTVFEDFDLSTRILKFGLISNPKDYTLFSNLAFSLASADRVEEAREAFNQIDHGALDEGWKIVVKATEGLLRFREGFPDEGRLFYSQAIDMAESHPDKGLKARAAIYLAREEIRARSPLAVEAVEAAFRVAQVKAEEPVPLLLTRLKQMQEESY